MAQEQTPTALHGLADIEPPGHTAAHIRPDDIDETTRQGRLEAATDGSASQEMTPLPLDDVAQLTAHRSGLSTAFYLLSFAPPMRSAFTSPKAFFLHPIILYIIGTLAALAAGVAMPSLDILYGYWSNGITPASASPDDISARSDQVAWIMTCIAVASLVLSWTFLTCFSMASHALTVRLRHEFVANILVQDAAYFDLVGPGEVAARAGKDISTVRTGLGEKIAFVVWSLSTLVTGIVSAFVHLPRLGGILFSIVPFTFIAFGILGKATDILGGPALLVEGRAASLLEQILSSVRVVQAFNMGPELTKRLNEGMLERLERLGMGRAFIRGIQQSVIYFVLNVSYAICFWYGSIRVAAGDDVGSVLTAFWNIINALFALANAVPHLSGIFDAYTALGLLRKQIERQPLIDIRNQEGLQQPATSSDAFELRNVTFAYPSRPHVKTLDDVSVSVEAGKVTAFVGPSGSGKSTIASLLLREYDAATCNVRNPADPLPEAEQAEKNREEAEQKKEKRQHSWRGRFLPSSKEDKEAAKKKLTFDEKDEDLEDASTMFSKHSKQERVVGSGEVFYAGHAVPDYNLRWLRSQIAVVSQHPQLFTASLFENVAAGLTGTQWAFKPDIDLAPDADEATKHKVELIRERCKQALIKADAWAFVSRLPEGMDTQISGGRAGVLSGGQRQRVAIARAIVREPQVLILDEGTSALDSATETRIKEMLEREQKKRGMTLVLIAHRLSTIAAADKIVVLKSGKIYDQGVYNDLISKDRPDGTFREMALAQQAAITVEDSSSSSASSSSSPSSKKRDASPSVSGPPPASTLAPESDILTPMYEETAAQRPQAAGLRRASGSSLLMRSFSGRGGVVEHHPSHIPATPQETGPSKMLGAQDDPAVPPASADDEAEGTSRSKDEAAAVDTSPHLARSRWRHVFRKLFAMLAAQKWFYLIGLVGAVLGGGSFPIAGWMTGQGVDALSISGDNARLRSESDRWALYFFVLAMADLVVFFVNALFLELASEATVRKLKLSALSALLRQEVGFFDHEDATSGALTSSVSSHPASVGAATGLILSQVILSLTNLLGSIILALVLSWRAALVCLAPVLVLFVSGFLEVAMLERYEEMAAKPTAAAAGFISESIDTIKTVSALGREAETMRTFDSEARSDPHRNKYLMLGAMGFAIGQAMVLFLSSLVFYWGGTLLSRGDISLSSLYAVFEGVIIGAFSASRLFTFVGDYGRALSAFATLESWFARKPKIAKIEPQWTANGEAPSLPPAVKSSATPEKIEEGQSPVSGSPGFFASLAPGLSHPTQGDIVFTNVEHRYPQRPKHPALRSIDLHIKAGSNVAFCGTSGSGKSSIMALMQRWYDPSRGTITYGGVDSRSIDPQELRKGMALVSQDPVLFEGTLRWNLTLGSPQPEKVTEQELEQACERACILEFIKTSLPDGFETDIGMKGAQLSGGQKQRICIARALLRKASILCLDEATSALDPTSEKLVQRALAKASEGTGITTIAIAHRLSTIKQADRIFVVEDGDVVEAGTHEELLSQRKRYYDLVAAQL